MVKGDAVHDAMDNPLVFLVLLTIGVFAVANGLAWVGGKTGWTGLRKFVMKGN